MNVIVFGTIFTGFGVVGPFANYDEAEKWGNEKWKGVKEGSFVWWVLRMSEAKPHG